MRIHTQRHLVLLLLVSALAFVAACEEYIEPPDVRLRFPAEGTFVEGDLLVLVFTEAVVPESLAVRVWNDRRNLENELPDDLVPLVDVCSVAASPCDEQGTTLEMAEDGRSATLYLDPEGIGKPDIPLLIEVLPGLRSVETRANLGRPRIFDFQYKPFEVREDPVDFEEGIYLFVSVFDEPLPNVITLMSDVQVTSDGRFMIAGAESDEIAGAAQNTRDPAELFIDETDQGFVVFAEGRIRENERNERFVETERFAIELRLGPLRIEIFGLRFTGIVVKNTDTGLDQLQGTLSFEGISLTADGGTPFIYDAGTTTFIADQVPLDLIPPGTPRICGDRCGSVPGQCHPPDPFPPGYCDDDEAAENDGSGGSSEE